jgi:uncharacterized protein
MNQRKSAKLVLSLVEVSAGTKNHKLMRYLLLLLMAASACTGPSHKKDLQVLVVAGGHSFDTLAFYSIFDGMEGLHVEMSMQPEANQLIASERAGEFDVMVLYDSWQSISETEKQAYLQLLEKGTGMVFLHHALVSYQEWPYFINIIGGKYKHPKFAADTTDVSDYRHDIHMTISPDPKHPVTAGIGPFEIFDEGYMNLDVLPTVNVLLTTDHPYCQKEIGWAHQVQNARVVYLLPGHGAPGFENETYRQIIENAVRWVAGK